MYAGNVLAKVQATQPGLQVLSIRPTSFAKAPLKEIGSTTVDTITIHERGDLSQWISEHVGKTDRPDLSSASIVVSGGRALQSSDNFLMLEQLAQKLGGGAVGASRAAVDAGMVRYIYIFFLFRFKENDRRITWIFRVFFFCCCLCQCNND
jgi:electron transfer flavoprotein alpha subunit